MASTVSRSDENLLSPSGAESVVSWRGGINELDVGVAGRDIVDRY